MTDRVGPFVNPQAFKTKSGKIVTYNEVSENDTNDRPVIAKSKLVMEKTGRNEHEDNTDVIKVEVATEKEKLYCQLDDYKDIEESAENDDGDNDDDYADDLNNKTVEEEEIITTNNLSPRKQHDRPVRQSQNIRISRIENNQAEPEGISVTAKGRKRRRVAVKAEETIESVMLQESEEVYLLHL